MACNCTTCVRWWLVLISIGFLIFSMAFFAGFIDKMDNQPWFKPIRNNCIGYYLVIFSIAFIAIYSFIGLIFSCVKKKSLYITYLILVLITILIEAIVIVVSLYFKNDILDTVEKRWYNSKNKENRFAFEYEFKCCGFRDYNPKDGCGYIAQRVYLCGAFVENTLIQYLVQIRFIAIYLILTQILPTILPCFLICCNQEDEGPNYNNNEVESTTSLYSQLIN